MALVAFGLHKNSKNKTRCGVDEMVCYFCSLSSGVAHDIVKIYNNYSFYLNNAFVDWVHLDKAVGYLRSGIEWHSAANL